MKKIFIILALLIIGFSLAGCTDKTPSLPPAAGVINTESPGDSTEPVSPDNKDQTFECPGADQWVDCMPTIGQGSGYCQWVQKNCPNAKIAY